MPDDIAKNADMSPSSRAEWVEILLLLIAFDRHFVSVLAGGVG